MPRTITAYACDYKCGGKVQTSRKRMVQHEELCFHNPARRACISCRYFESYDDSNGMEHEPQNLHTWRHTECLASEDIDISEKLTHNCDLYVQKLN